MKEISLIFDKNGTEWHSDEGLNLAFLLNSEVYLNKLIADKGYLYLSQIYKHLGIKWDTQKEDIKFTNNEELYLHTLEFETFPQKEDSIVLIIRIMN